MERIKFIPYKGKSILIEDFSNMRPGKELLETIAFAQKTIASQPPHSVLAVLDATGAMYDSESISSMKAFVKANGPYIQCSAVVGGKGMLSIALNALARISGRDFRTFETREAAMDYLIIQAAKTP